MALTLSFFSPLKTWACSVFPEQEQQAWVKSLDHDPFQFMHQQLQQLHNQLTHKNPSAQDRARQMQLISQIFDTTTWLWAIEQLEGLPLEVHDSVDLQYLFTSWLRERYMGQTYRVVRQTELVEAFRIGGRYNETVQARVSQTPAEVRVTGFRPFHCQSQNDKESYQCSQPHYIAEVQLSPHVLCQSSLIKNYRFDYILRLDAQRGFRIVDVRRGPQGFYQQAYINYKNHLQTKTVAQLRVFLRQLTFSSQQDLHREEVRQFVERARQNTPSRIPASEVKQ